MELRRGKKLTKKSIVSVDGLTGDINLVKKRVENRTAKLVHLQDQVDKLKGDESDEKAKVIADMEAEEAAITTEMIKVEEDLQRQIKEFQKRLRKLASERKQKLKTVVDSYSALQRPIADEIAQLEHLNGWDKHSVAPLRKIPAELLSYIFKYYADLDQSPWTLMLVSRSWRQMAVTTPGLWTRILVITNALRQSRKYRHLHTSEHSVLGVRRYSVGSRVICRTSKELRLICRGAGSLPLDLHVAYHNAPADLALLRGALEEGPISCRITALQVQCESNQSEQLKLEMARLTNLKSLAVCSETGPGFLNGRGSSIPSIFEPKIITAPSNDPAVQDPIPWTTLHSLDLSNTHGNTLVINLNKRIAELTKLITLNGPRGWPSEGTPVTQFGNMLSIGLWCRVEHLSRLQLPVLTHLNLNIGEHWTDHINPTTDVASFSFPALIHLEIHSRVGHPLSLLSILSAPLLKDLHLFHESRTLHIPPFENLSFPNVTSFSLCAPCTDAVAISALVCVPAAKHVKLAVYPVAPNPWGTGILRYLVNSEDELCPSLETLTLGTTEYLIGTDKSAIKRWMQRIKQRQTDRGVEMKSLLVYWTARSKGRQPEIGEYA